MEIQANEPPDGVSWACCAWGPEIGLHLTRKTDHDVFTGVVLDDSTRSLLPGGEAVLFSPDHHLHLAYEQRTKTGETLKLYKRNGVMLWKR